MYEREQRFMFISLLVEKVASPAAFSRFYAIFISIGSVDCLKIQARCVGVKGRSTAPLHSSIKINS